MEMQMPKPGPGHQKIATFAGTWTGEETMHPSQWCPQGGKAEGTTTSRVACDGFYVVGDYEQRTAGKVTYRGHSVMSFDTQKDEVVLYWFDSMGMGVDEFRGKFQGNKLVLTAKNPMGMHRMTYDTSEKGTLRTRMEMSADGKQWAPMFDAAYHLKK